jgi:hypothetical protein
MPGLSDHSYENATSPHITENQKLARIFLQSSSHIVHGSDSIRLLQALG